MPSENDKNYVSIGFWMLAMFVLAIPCIGWVMVLVWAFAGENESRKNYFKAMLLWIVIIFGLIAILAALGTLPEVVKRIQEAMPKR